MGERSCCPDVVCNPASQQSMIVTSGCCAQVKGVMHGASGRIAESCALCWEVMHRRQMLFLVIVLMCRGVVHGLGQAARMKAVGRQDMMLATSAVLREMEQYLQAAIGSPEKLIASCCKHKQQRQELFEAPINF